MRGIRGFVFSTVMASATLLPIVAHADGGCPASEVPVAGPGGGTICIPAADPSTGGGLGGDPGSGSGGTDGGGEPIYDPTGCFLSYINPQPDAGHPAWAGHKPDEGALYFRRCRLGSDPQGTPIIFVPEGEKPEPPDPADLAREALDRLRLATPDVHLAPAPPARTYVGLDTWLWMPPGQWSSLKKSVTAGDTTVTVTAVPKSVLWNMGPGSTTCYSAGREWKPAQMPKGATTDCSYKYQKISDFEPGRKFKISATITYQANWTCEGECLSDEGDLGGVPGPAGGAAISVGERQSVVVSGGEKQ
jgi:hypothetical protein